MASCQLAPRDGVGLGAVLIGRVDDVGVAALDGPGEPRDLGGVVGAVVGDTVAHDDRQAARPLRGERLEPGAGADLHPQPSGGVRPAEERDGHPLQAAERLDDAAGEVGDRAGVGHRLGEVEHHPVARVVEVAVAEQRALQVVHAAVADEGVREGAVLAVEDLARHREEGTAMVGDGLDVAVDLDAHHRVHPADLTAPVTQHPVGDGRRDESFEVLDLPDHEHAQLVLGEPAQDVGDPGVLEHPVVELVDDAGEQRSRRAPAVALSARRGAPQGRSLDRA